MGPRGKAHNVGRSRCKVDSQHLVCRRVRLPSRKRTPVYFKETDRWISEHQRILNVTDTTVGYDNTKTEEGEQKAPLSLQKSARRKFCTSLLQLKVSHQHSSCVSNVNNDNEHFFLLKCLLPLLSLPFFRWRFKSNKEAFSKFFFFKWISCWVIATASITDPTRLTSMQKLTVTLSSTLILCKHSIIEIKIIQTSKESFAQY